MSYACRGRNRRQTNATVMTDTVTTANQKSNVSGRKPLVANVCTPSVRTATLAKVPLRCHFSGIATRNKRAIGTASAMANTSQKTAAVDNSAR